MLELARRIERAPVSAVRGIGGIGKTALVLATIHQRFADRVEDVALVRLARPTDAEPTWTDLVRVLAHRLGWQTIDLDRPVGEEVVAAIIDLAERARLWIVLDDVHAAPAFAEPLLSAFATFARSSRLIAISREDVPGVPTPQQLVLDGLADRDQAALAAEVSPGLDPSGVANIIRSAGGSPWHLLEALAGRDPRRQSTTSHLPPSARALVERLAVIEVPVDDATLVALGADDAVRGALERGGLIERSPAGVRLHDLARSAVVRDGRQASCAAEVGALLAARPDVRLVLEGARLLLSSGREPAAAEVLAAAGEVALASGQAARLWTLMEACGGAGARLASLRLRCAVELGRPDTALEQGAPEEADHAGRLWRAYALFQAGDVAAAASEAAPLTSSSASSPANEPRADARDRLRLEAALLHARCLGTLGRFEAAIAVLDQIPAADDGVRALVTAHRARWLLHLDPVGARKLCEAVAQQLSDERALPDYADSPALPGHAESPALPGLRRQICERLAGAFVMFGRFRAAVRLLPELRDGDGSELFMSRELALWRLAVITFTGRSREARQLAKRLGSLQDVPPSQTQYARLLAIPLAIAAGDALDELPATIERLAADAANCGHAQIYQLAVAWRATLAIVRGEPELSLEWCPAVPRPAGLEALHLDIVTARHARRWEGSPGPRGREETLAAPAEEFVSVAIANVVALAEAAMVSGEAKQAIAHAARSRDLAAEHDHLLSGADAQLTLCEATLIAGELPDLAARAADLERIARALELPRFTSAARWFMSLVAPDGVDGAALECCACDPTDPVSARRARALLTGELCAENLDLLDRVVLAAAARAGADRLSTVIRARPCPWQPGWGIDSGRRALWLPGGVRVDLTASPLAVQLLEVIAQSGGTATKEQLTCAVWNERAYHPLRHDKRLQVAVLRLRKLMEDDPGRPVRLVTTDDGYAFGSNEPARYLRAP